MTAEQLEELLSAYQNGGMSDVQALRNLAPTLTRRVIAAEKLVDDAEGIMHGLIVNDSWCSHEVNKLLYEITVYREASKHNVPTDN